MGVIEGSVPRGAGVITGPGKDWYVKATALLGGSDSASGDSWTQAFLTMATAFTAISSGDRVHYVGNIAEALTTPARVFDVELIAHANRARHEDTHPVPIGGPSAAKWTAPSNNPCLKVIQQGWKLTGGVFAAHSTNCAVYGQRNADDGLETEIDASHLTLSGVRFASGRDGFESGELYNVAVEDCTFANLTGYALKYTVQAGVAAPQAWQIRRNRFFRCVNLMGAWTAQNFEFIENTVQQITTAGIDFFLGANNTVVRNSFDIAAAEFDPSGTPLWRGSTTDVWSNYLIDALESGLPA